MSPYTRRESGQAAPLYITAVTGLLFLALIFFAFGEADVKRNGAQSAADASALAAAKESRTLLGLELKVRVMDRAFYTEVFNAPYVGLPGCYKAISFAAQNDARIEPNGCNPLTGLDWGYKVKLRTNKAMSANLVPGTEGKRAKATAAAIVEGHCKFIPNPIPTSPSIGEVVCTTGLTWVVSPQSLAIMPDMADLFSVRLVED
ncbi:pilus assembly protein TadG-related protein [Streptomyces sp. NBC_01463]